MDSLEISALATALAEKLGAKQTVTRMSFNELATQYMENYARPRKRTWQQDQRRIEMYLQPAFGDLDLSDLTVFILTKWHATLGTRAPYAANRALEQLGVMLKQAQVWGFFPEDKILPTSRVTPFPETSRERFVTPDEMPRLAQAINRIPSYHLRVLLWLYLQTGLRKNELLQSKWSDLDTSNWVLKVPARVAKNGRSHEVALNAESMALISKLPRRSEFIFTGKSGHLKRFDKAWNRVKAHSGLTDIRVHDLRRTYGCWMARSGTPAKLISEAMNHKCLKSTDVYMRFLGVDLKQAMLSHADSISRYM